MTRAPRLSALVAALAFWLAPASAQQSNTVNLPAVTNIGTVPTSGGGTGSVTLGSSANSLLGNYDSVLYTVTGLTTGTLVPEGQSCDVAGTWTAINVTNIQSGTVAASITANGVYSAYAHGFCSLRLRGNTVTVGTAAVSITAGYGTPIATLTASITGTVTTNIAQWGGSNVVTGIGGAGAGVPRVTLSTDSAVIVTGSTASDGSTTITLGGTAQNLFSGATPTNGWWTINPDATEDCWVSDSTTAAANNTGSARLVANGGSVMTPPGYKPFSAVSIVCATTGHKLTARKW